VVTPGPSWHGHATLPDMLVADKNPRVTLAAADRDPTPNEIFHDGSVGCENFRHGPNSVHVLMHS
jgi:hypothetical protein